MSRPVDRRTFLRGLLGAATGAALAPLVGGGLARAGEPAEFAAGLERHPWLAGWRSMRAETLGPGVAEVRGRWPAALRGTLYRNGPAWFERGDFRYEHWFDGDGMLQAWRLGPDGVSHRGRMVATPKFVREQRAGRFLVPAAGTEVPDTRAIRNNDDATPANTSVMRLGGRVFALSEAGSAFEIDAGSLETLGAVRWREDLATLPFSAHPLFDRDGSAWNFGGIGMMGGGSDLLLWHVGRDGALRDARTIACPALGYLHSFAMTATHLVFVLTPYELADSGAFFQRLRFQAAHPCHVAVVPKHDLDAARWFEVDFAMAYHFADAMQRGDALRVTAVLHDDLAAARSPMAHAMRGHARHDEGHARLAHLHLDLRTGRARWERTDVRGLEFPVFDTRTPGDRAARLYAPMTIGEAPMFNAVMSLDAAGRRRVHRYDAGVLAEEHLFVPRPGSSTPDDGWLVGTLLDSARDRHGLAVFDAHRVDAGPLAEAWLPYSMPLGFHGAFAPA